MIVNDEMLPQEFDYTPKEEFDYSNDNTDIDWDDEYEQTYCDEENNFEIIEEIDLLGNKIKRKAIRNNTN
jgi:hypothetical protein